MHHADRCTCLHLHAAFAGPSPGWPGFPSTAGGTPHASHAAACGGDASEDGPSIVGSEASTPGHGGHQRGSPSRQQLLHSFQAYLQQQLAAQQRWRRGPGSQGGGAAAATAPASPDGSPQHGDAAHGEAAEAALSALPGGSPPGTARRAPRDSAGARLAAAAAAGLAPATSTTHAGAAPLSGLSSAAPLSSNPLLRADSTFSSWGLPTPTTGEHPGFAAACGARQVPAFLPS